VVGKPRSVKHLTRKTRRGHRSGEAEQRRYVNRLISKAAYRDLKKAESINVLTPDQINQQLHEQYENVIIYEHLQLERGLVLSDPRGEGELQRHIEE